MTHQLSPKKDEDEPLPKKPRSSDDYVEYYTNVLPSHKVIADIRHLSSIQQE